jgi:cell division protein FtsW
MTSLARPSLQGLRAAWLALAARAAAWRGHDRVPVRDRVHLGAGQPVRVLGFDTGVVWVVAALVALGLVMVYSASVALPDNPKFARYTPTHFVWRHLMFIGIALCAALVAVQVPMRVWEKVSPGVFLGAVVLLIAVLVVGKDVNGARRWLPLGIMSFQPSELAKLGMAMYAAGYMVRKMDARENFFRAVYPMAIAIAIVGLLLLAEPDMGAFMVIAVIAMGILFLGGACSCSSPRCCSARSC